MANTKLITSLSASLSFWYVFRQASVLQNNFDKQRNDLQLNDFVSKRLVTFTFYSTLVSFHPSPLQMCSLCLIQDGDDDECPESPPEPDYFSPPASPCMQLTSSDTAQHEPEEVLPSILPMYVLTASFIVDDILMVSLFQCNHGLFYLSRLQ